jgi:NAD(P)-dependent dehydrogenase (short-subunit alcohol dehydrogenase family)
VSNARPELPTFYQPPLEVTLESWNMALDSQAAAFLIGAQESCRLMRVGGRILAVTYAPSARTGSWQPWVAMGAGKAAVEALVRYFAVALARRGITVNAVSPGLTLDSVLSGLPQPVQDAAHAWHVGGWTPMGRMGTPADIGGVVSLLCSEQAAWITGQTIYADGGASLMDTVFPLEIQGAHA